MIVHGIQERGVFVETPISIIKVWDADASKRAHKKSKVKCVVVIAYRNEFCMCKVGYLEWQELYWCVHRTQLRNTAYHLLIHLIKLIKILITFAILSSVLFRYLLVMKITSGCSINSHVAVTYSTVSFSKHKPNKI